MTERTLSDRYRLENRIGSGGMATVYAGIDTVLRRRIAVKVLRPQFAADQDFVRRFYFEAQHAAKLSHPNVVNIYDVGHEGETYFIVMELVDGTTLAEMIEHDGRLPEPVAIDFATQICAGLAYAHRQGILHRDIKPANILVTKDDVVKLSDFGIARAVTTQTVTITQPGMVMGSVYYLSPEQAQGHELAETSDLYSLGVVLYQILSGTLPYTGESPVTVALKHVSSPIPSLAAIEPEISPALAAIVQKLLQKDPAARFGSATEVAKALREARENPLVTVPIDVAAPGAVAAPPLLPPKPRPSRFPDRRNGKGVTPHRVDAHEPYRATRSGMRPPVYVWIALLVLAALAGYFLFSRGTLFGPPTPVALVNVSGRTVADAEKALDAVGLDYTVLPVPSETIPKDRVVRQDPAPPRKLPPRSVVRLYVSTGLPSVGLIDLRHYSRDDAERYLHDAKLVPVVALRYDAAVPKGVVMTQNPLPNTQVPIRSKVALVVSEGPKPVAVPDLVTRLLNDATAELANRGLRLEIADRVPSDDIAADTVTSQNPPPGSQVDPGSIVTVVVSAGAQLFAIPDVRGRNVTDASGALQAAGLAPRYAYVVDGSVPIGTVLEEDPAPGTRVKKGTTVALGVGVPGSVPDVGGMTLDAARAILQSAGYSIGGVLYDGGGDAGKVVRTDPPANAQLRPGATVIVHLAGAAGQ